MFIVILKRLIVFIFILFSVVFAKAQQVHFIYLQTENGQPFYVKLDKKVVSSSSAGYLILPKLVDGDYKLSVGFPKKEFPEENFQITIDKKNQGFLLKNFGEKGWGLFNMQSFAVVMGGGTNAPDTISKNFQSDPFSKMLANVVKDSSILQKNEPVKEEPVKEVVSTPQRDSTVTIVEQAPVLLSPAKKLLSKKNEDGLEMVYVDPVEKGNDTVRIFIPTESVIIKTDTLNNNTVQTEKALEPAPKDTVSIMDTVSLRDNFVARDTASMNDSKQEPNVTTDTTASVHPLVSENKSPLEQKDKVDVKKDSVVVKNDEEIKQKNEEVKQPEIIQQDSTTKENKKSAE